MTDANAIRRIRSGEEKAIAALMNKYSRMLWKTAAGILTSSEEDIEECVADVFITLWQKPELYDETRGKLSTWLCKMAKNKALDRLRSIKARREDPVEEIAETAAPTDERESGYDLEQYLSLLPEEDREIVKRRYYDEQKPAEIAQEMGMEKKKVENRLFRSKKKLKGMLMDMSTS
ncbi:MAG: sigma-70 family RNA polymerase sigma factor [Lachnospiraceae bacterium]|nr:sigma-70 family RNA polymerase sigma factor [Lachnospiraceae bacterium]